MPVVIHTSKFGSATGQRERRVAPRTPMVFTIGKLVVMGVEYPCMVRNLSATGMQIQMPAPPPTGTAVTIEMSGMPSRDARVQWAGGRVAGLRFDAPCSVSEVFDARQGLHRGPVRSPRFRLERACTLHLGRDAVEARLVDISVGGAQLIAATPLNVGRAGIIALGLSGGAMSPGGKICWTKGDTHGFAFDQPLSSITLAHALQGAVA